MSVWQGDRDRKVNLRILDDWCCLLCYSASLMRQLCSSNLLYYSFIPFRAVKTISPGTLTAVMLLQTKTNHPSSLDTLLFPIILCDVDDFRYFGLEFLNRCVDHSEGLSHRYLFSISSYFYCVLLGIACERQKYMLKFLTVFKTLGDNIWLEAID
jgi:hypothetical protein